LKCCPCCLGHAKRYKWNPFVQALYDIEDLGNAIRKILADIGSAPMSKSFPGMEKLIETIKSFIKNVS
jgi:hypothetical protein